MNLFLHRTISSESAILGSLEDESNNHLFVTLEHAYPVPSHPLTRDITGYAPKLPPGTYTCKRGKHRLHSMTEDFETFEVLGVPGHTGILFHVGNFNKDSEGCILIGTKILDQGIYGSREAFEKFMELQTEINEFQLKVE